MGGQMPKPRRHWWRPKPDDGGQRCHWVRVASLRDIAPSCRQHIHICSQDCGARRSHGHLSVTSATRRAVPQLEPGVRPAPHAPGVLVPPSNEASGSVRAILPGARDFPRIVSCTSPRFPARQTTASGGRSARFLLGIGVRAAT
jgi:hypothetical protein